MSEKNVQFTQAPTSKARPATKAPATKTVVNTAQEMEGRVDFENDVRSAPTGQGSVSVEVCDTDGMLYDPADDPSPKENKEHGTFRRDFVLLPEQAMTDCANAVVQEACNNGYRPTGLASVESVKPHADGHHVVVTWALPVSDQKRAED